MAGLRAPAVLRKGGFFSISAPGIFPRYSRSRAFPTPHLQRYVQTVFVSDGETVFLKISLTSTVLKHLPKAHVGMENTIIWPLSLIVLVEVLSLRMYLWKQIPVSAEKNI